MINDGYLLLVEDEPLVQANNKMILERHGYRVRLTYSLEEAWAAINEEMPSAIVLDIQLPDGSGIDFLCELRKTSSVPVLVLTAMGTPQDIVAGLESGGDDYLTKPYDLSVFLARVRTLLRRGSLESGKAEDLFADFIKRVETLTPTEKNIFQHYVEGKHSINELPSVLFISTNTLKVHNKHIYSKLGVSSNNELMLYIDMIKKSGFGDKILQNLSEA